MIEMNMDELIKLSDLSLSGYIITGFKGSCDYYHYGMQNTDDRGWGCGYRTLQTIISWFHDSQATKIPIPSLQNIQKILYQIEDKPAEFVGSHEWIGAVECGHVIAHLTNAAFRILHVPSGRFTSDHLHVLLEHFKMTGSPVMMGGQTDNSSKGILAIGEGNRKTKLLICDPHFYSKIYEPTLQRPCSNQWIKWFDTTELTEESFYNICLPIYMNEIT